MMKFAIAVLSGILFWTSAGASEYAFVNVNVITMTESETLRGQTVVVSDGVIASIGPVDDQVVPDTATIIDGTDRYLMPGLAEMHAHIPPAGAQDLERILTLFAVNGVTTVRGMLGHPSHLSLRDALESGSPFGPRLYTSGPSFNGSSVTGPRQAADRVRAQHLAGYDFLKVHPGLDVAEFTAMATAANTLGIRFTGHVPADVGLPLALNQGISTIEHLDGYMQQLIPADADPSGGYDAFFGLLLAPQADARKIAGLARMTRDAGVSNSPTQTLFEKRVGPDDPALMAKSTEMSFMPLATVQRWVRAKEELQNDRSFDPDVASRAIRLRRSLIKALHDEGAEILLGSDAPQVFNVPGFSAHHELALLVASGLTPFAALQTGTSNSARWLGVDDRRGTVETGKDADLLLLDDSPLADIKNTQRIHGVMLRGEWLDRSAIDARLERYARQP